MTTLPAFAALDPTHDPAAKSWLASANGHADFPIQNLPLAVFRRAGSAEAWRGGVAVGDQIVDCAALAGLGTLVGGAMLSADALAAVRLASQPTLNALMAAGAPARRALRHGLFAALHSSAGAAVQNALQRCLVPQAQAQYALPSQIGDYTDFYTSIHHARNVGRVVRPDNPLTPNFQWLPIAYHGRASSVVVSGTAFRRPMGQAMAPGEAQPAYGACKRLDYELELGFWVAGRNAMGEPIALAQAEDHLFGVCLLNDWSARDHQFWEMAPLGPFLGKNFCTSVSPWIITPEALAPFRRPFVRPADEPQPLAYLDHASNRTAGAIDIQLSVAIGTEQHRQRGLAASEVSRTTFAHQYWTPAQMIAQHTVGGCNLNAGDLIGSGTISGPAPTEAGAIVELSRGGQQDVLLSATGEVRRFLQDGDEVVLQGWCQAPGAARIGLGQCCGIVLPATAP